MKCHLLLFNATTTNHISIRLWRVTKSGLYRITSDDRLSGWTKKKSQSQTCLRTVMVTVWWSAVCLIHYSSLNPSKAITSEKYAQQIDEIHWKLQCLQLALVNRIGPTLHHDTRPLITQPTLHFFFFLTTNTSKVEWIGLQSFASSAIFSWLLTNWLPLLQASWQLFCRKMFPQLAGGRKFFPEVHWILKHGLLCYRNKWNYFLLAKMYWL